jgi:hypothetical protein
MNFKPIMICAVSLLWGLFAASEIDSSAATSPLVDEGLVAGARAIVEGSVVGVEARVAPDGEHVFTYTTLRIDALLKGDIEEREIVLKEEGGETETIGERVFGAPRFDVGERAIVYLDSWADGSPRVYQMFLGKLLVETDPATGGEVVLPESANQEGLFVTREPRRGNEIVAPANLDDYISQVRRAVRRTDQLSSDFAAQHYFRPMLSRPPEYADRGSGAWSTQVALLPIPARWFEPDSNLPLTFFINPNGAPNPSVVDDVGAAIDAWSAVPATSIRLVNGGQKEVCGLNGIVSVVFNNCDGRFQAEPGCARIIARGGVVWDNRITRQINGQTFRKALRGFVSLNPFSACSYDNHCDLREVVTHELGHALGLGHSEFPEATMFGTIHFDSRCASLRTDDAHALEFVYPTADPGPKPLAVTTSTVSDGIVGERFVQVLEAEGGTMPYTWAWLPGPGRVPDGLVVDAGGALVGILLQPGTFTFPIEVADAAGAVVDRTFTMTVLPDSTEYQSEFFSQQVENKVLVGQPFEAVLRWVNTGTKEWDPAGGFSVVSQYPSNNTTWGVNRITPTGSPVQPGNSLEVRIRATAPARSGAYEFQWRLHQDGVGIIGQPSQSVSIFVYVRFPPAFDSPTTLQAAVGTPFNFQFKVKGGTPPFAWSVAAGDLPAGLAVDPVSGVLAGTPTALGSFVSTIRATDSESRIAQARVSITVTNSVLRIDGLSSTEAIKGSPFSVQLNAAGGTPPYSWSIGSGSLPGGLALDPSTGLIHGTPTLVGTFQAGVAVRDQKSQIASGNIQIVVIEAADIPVITSAKYKVKKRKLTVTADKLESQAVLMVDGSPVSARFDAGKMIAKKLDLASGQHQIMAVNPGGMASQPFVLAVP